jgi:hypothetical protein
MQISLTWDHATVKISIKVKGIWQFAAGFQKTAF